MLKQLVEEIHAAGLSEAEIAKRCETSQPTIHRIRTGKTGDTRSSIADRVRALHRTMQEQGVFAAQEVRAA